MGIRRQATILPDREDLEDYKREVEGFWGPCE
jgi:hypothetical protein